MHVRSSHRPMKQVGDRLILPPPVRFDVRGVLRIEAGRCREWDFLSEQYALARATPKTLWVAVCHRHNPHDFPLSVYRYSLAAPCHEIELDLVDDFTMGLKPQYKPHAYRFAMKIADAVAHWTKRPADTVRAA